MTAVRGGLRAGVGRVLLVTIVLSAVGGVAWYRRVTRETVAPAPLPEVPDPGGAEMVLREFRHAETRMDRTIWVLEAERAEVAGDVARLGKVNITWHGDDPRRLPVTITSRTGRVNLRTNDAALEGRVRVVRSDGATLTTGRLEWDNRRRQLRAPSPVTVRARGLSFRGNSMYADLDRQVLRLAGSVTATVGGAALERAGGLSR